MSIASEITRLQTAKADLKTAIEGKGVAVSASATLDAYADLVDAIETGGGSSTGDVYFSDYLSGNLTEYHDTKSTTIYNYALYQYRPLTLLRMDKLLTTTSSCFYRACENGTMIFPVMNNTGGGFSQCYAKVIDFGGDLSITSVGFNGSTYLDTLIFRKSSGPVSLGNITHFGGTPFKSGGTGGTIYIPKVLYDELGTGSALDYKAATNWATIDGYGTITWAQIEGSQYENYYADGTPIPTA